MGGERAVYSRAYLRFVAFTAAVLQVLALVFVAPVVADAASALPPAGVLVGAVLVFVVFYLIPLSVLNFLRLSIRVVLRPESEEVVIKNLPWAQRPIRYRDLVDCSIDLRGSGLAYLSCPQFELGSRVLLGLTALPGAPVTSAEELTLLPEPFRSAPINYVVTDSPSFRSAVKITLFVGLATLSNGRMP